MEEPFQVTFSNESRAYAIRVSRSEDLDVALYKLGLPHSHPVLAIVGGASGLSDSDASLLRPLFVQVLAPLAEAVGASVVDGGTKAGIMQLMGQARTETHATFPLIGVAAVNTITLPYAPLPRPGSAALEPNHTHFVLVPGSEWGDDSFWLARVVSVLAKKTPSVTVLVNGGEIAWKDVAHSIEVGRPVIAIAGSGRAADVLVSALRGEATNRQAKNLAIPRLVQIVDKSAHYKELAKVILQALSAKE
jgi:hypothetical protein